MSAILSVQGLSVQFGALKAVHDVSFEARPGRITAVIGPNGAGKSSLFNLISGAIRPSAGQVLFEGRDMTGQRPDKMLAAGLARSFQITNLFFELPVRENLRLAAQFVENGRGLFRGVAASRAALARVDELIERFALQARADELEIIRTGKTLNIEERETWFHQPDTWVSTTKVPLYEPSALRTLPFGSAILLMRSAAPIKLTLRPWTRRKDAAELTAARESLERALTGAAAGA